MFTDFQYFFFEQKFKYTNTKTSTVSEVDKMIQTEHMQLSFP